MAYSGHRGVTNGRSRVGHGSLLTDPSRPIRSWTQPDSTHQRPTRPIATVRPTVRPTDIYAYLLIMFAPVTECLKNNRFIHECLLYTENNFSRTSSSLNCVNFLITLSVIFCLIQGDPHRPTQMDPTQPTK